MSCSSIIDTTEHVAHVAAIGSPTQRDFIAEFRDLFRNPDYQPHFDILFDLQHVTAMPPEGTLRVIAFYLGTHRKSIAGKVALITSDRKHHMCAPLAYQARQTGIRMRIFERVSDAELWLRSRYSGSSF